MSQETRALLLCDPFLRSVRGFRRHRVAPPTKPVNSRADLLDNGVFEVERICICHQVHHAVRDQMLVIGCLQIVELETFEYELAFAPCDQHRNVFTSEEFLFGCEVLFG